MNHHGKYRKMIFNRRSLAKVDDDVYNVFVCFYRENMEKVNIKFHDNGTVTYQHKKILQFVPEMSVDKDQKLTVPNIPLLVRKHTEILK